MIDKSLDQQLAGRREEDEEEGEVVAEATELEDETEEATMLEEPAVRQVADKKPPDAKGDECRAGGQHRCRWEYTGNIASYRCGKCGDLC